MIGPISPDEAKATIAIPEAVFEVVNELLRERAGSGRCTLKQNEVVKLLLAKVDVGESEIFRRNWLDFEEAYRAAGWKVEYDKPGYNETYEATWAFSRGSKVSP